MAEKEKTPGGQNQGQKNNSGSGEFVTDSVEVIKQICEALGPAQSCSDGSYNVH